MPIRIPSDTAEVLGTDAKLCRARSLFMDKFSDPEATAADRKAWFERLRDLPAERIRRPILQPTADSTVLYAQNQSRLMVNMAGGVMENAGLCLDRFGLPSIPGSAVKACARRMALQELMGARSIDEKVGILVDLAQVFGWVEVDWKSGRREKDRTKPNRHRSVFSDLWWAMEEGVADEGSDSRRQQVWEEVCPRAAGELARRTGDPGSADPLRKPRSLAGRVSFLPAQNVDCSGLTLAIKPPVPGTLELDVLTGHHGRYYSGSTSVALDDDQPNPVIFPALAPGHVLAFVLVGAPGCSNELLVRAKAWLAAGLSLFGLGAKTAAGYGWFDASDELQDKVGTFLRDRDAQDQKERLRKKALEEEQRDLEARMAERREKESKLAGMTEDERLDFELDQMPADRRLQWMEKIDQRSEAERSAIHRYLSSRRTDVWADLRRKADEGKQKERQRFTPLVQEMRRIAKLRKEKMP
jgi:CRISPR-associated protein Cmr6